MASVKDWRDTYSFYHTPKPCCVCGSREKIGIEPRFGYPVCEKHSSLSPVQISEQRTDGK